MKSKQSLDQLYYVQHIANLTSIRLNLEQKLKLNTEVTSQLVQNQKEMKTIDLDWERKFSIRTFYIEHHYIDFQMNNSSVFRSNLCIKTVTRWVFISSCIPHTKLFNGSISLWFINFHLFRVCNELCGILMNVGSGLFCVIQSKKKAA